MLHYKRFFDLSIDLLCIASLDGRFQRINHAFQRVLGYSEKELLNASFLDFIHPNDVAETNRALADLKAGLPVNSFENRYRCQDGTYRWLQWTSQPVVEEGLIYAIARDISAQKAADSVRDSNLRLNAEIEDRKTVEMALRTSEARLAGILNLAFDAIISIDEAQRITLFNYGASQMFGYTPEEALGQPLGVLLPPALAERHEQHIIDFARSPTTGRRMHERGVVYARRKDGTLFPAEASISKLRLGDETVFTVFMRDISLRVAAQTESQRFASIIDATSDVVYITLNNRECVYINHAGYHLLGVDESVPPAQIDISALYTPETNARLQTEALPAALARGYWSGEGLVKVGTDSTMPVSIMLLTPHDHKGQAEYTAVILRDVSESKRTESELRANLERAHELNNLKTRFMSMVSHEFMTPLTIMMTACELIRNYSDRMPPEKRMAHIEKIEAHIHYLTGLVNNVLSVSRSDMVEVEFKPARIDLNTFLRALVDEIQIVAEKHRLEYINTAPCPMTWGDERLLRQVFNNLIMNAVKYSPSADRVTIELSCSSADVAIIRVRDYGIGIPESDQRHLFSSFFRARNVGDIPGTGLGLVVVQRAVNAHGGTVTVESQVGRGTSFTVRLPLVNEQGAQLA